MFDKIIPGRSSRPVQGREPASEAYVLWYVRERQLTRPKGAIAKLLGLMLLAAGLVFGIGYGLAAADIAGAWIIAAAATVVLTARLGVVAAVEVYQRYASDEIRRSCQMMPTCSEYCILAVRKYGAVWGMCKTLHRLFFVCKGPHFHEDWP